MGASAKGAACPVALPQVATFRGGQWRGWPGGQAQDDEKRQDQPVRVGPAPGPLPGAQAGDGE